MLGEASCFQSAAILPVDTELWSSTCWQSSERKELWHLDGSACLIRGFTSLCFFYFVLSSCYKCLIDAKSLEIRWDLGVRLRQQWKRADLAENLKARILIGEQIRSRRISVTNLLSSLVSVLLDRVSALCSGEFTFSHSLIFCSIVDAAHKIHFIWSINNHEIHWDCRHLLAIDGKWWRLRLGLSVLVPSYR